VWRLLRLRMVIVWFLFLFGTRFELGAGVSEVTGGVK
jgi:hypothetical protein